MVYQPPKVRAQIEPARAAPRATLRATLRCFLRRTTTAPPSPARAGTAARAAAPAAGITAVRAAAGPLRLRAGLVGRRLLLPFRARLPRAAERLHAQRLGAAPVRAPDHKHQAPAAQPHARAGRVAARAVAGAASARAARHCRAPYWGVDCAMQARRAAVQRGPASTCTSCRRMNVLSFRSNGARWHTHESDEHMPQTLHLALLASPHRTADAAEADFFFVPVWGLVGFGGARRRSTGAPTAPTTAWPYFNRRGGARPPVAGRARRGLVRHAVGSLLDELRNGIVLSHWAASPGSTAFRTSAASRRGATSSCRRRCAAPPSRARRSGTTTRRCARR